MAMVGLTGRKLAWCNVGDASIQLFRRAPGEGRLRCVFSTVEQRSTMRTASGQEIQMPLQLGCYSHADQTVEHAVKSMEGANFGIMTPEVGDIILVCSDGVTDNLGGNLLVRSLEAHYVIAWQCHRTSSRTASLRHRRPMSSNSFHYVIAGQCHRTAFPSSTTSCTWSAPPP